MTMDVHARFEQIRATVPSETAAAVLVLAEVIQAVMTRLDAIPMPQVPATTPPIPPVPTGEPMVQAHCPRCGRLFEAPVGVVERCPFCATPGGGMPG